ncbi:GntR family transcriptional regulator [Ottowia thiooxydans]|uniref:GntR family transcriptional regulator n=1 Tax=Ottowia thiooxydans TaxID=219182 RepID=UPI00146BA841|nr:GntR family transcriptional regulator [Ottowia thiooxydans]
MTLVATTSALDRERQTTPQVYDSLRESIICLQLPPGQVLDRTELAKTFSISQTPVREALIRLREEYLVEVIPQVSTRVSLISLARAEDAIFLRRAIELEVVHELALRADVQLTTAMWAIWNRQQACEQAGDLDGFMTMDEELHHLMYQWLRKESLWRLVRIRSGDVDRIRWLHLPLPGKAKRVLEEHKQLIHALEKNDVGLAQTYLRNHLPRSAEAFSQIRDEHPGFFSPI